MIWPPLVSARAYRDACSERDRLREQNAMLVDHLTRIVRRAEGMSEAPQARKRERLEIPADVLASINVYESPAIRQERSRQAIRVYRETGSWAEAKAAIKEDGE